MNKSDFKILIVDDDEITREMLETIVMDEGFPVVSTVDGLDAIRLLRIEDVSMVITDFRMPGANGIDVLKQAVKTNPDIAVVILTAYGTLETILESIKLGAYDYITKPFNTRQIRFVAEKAFQRAELISEKRELAKHLRDTYRDLELIKNVAESKNPEVALNWLERLERLKTLKVITEDDAEILKERLISGGSENNKSNGEG